MFSYFKKDIENGSRSSYENSNDGTGD
jgi:hypothetical protein